jgi:sulfopyruvate decarboxylase subunit alpha
MKAPRKRRTNFSEQGAMRMRRDTGELVVKGLKEAEISFLTTLSESWLHEVHKQVSEDPYFKVVPVANEAEGVGICAGMWLGGKKSAILMENSGVRVACESLARLQGIPVLLMMSYRGDWGDAPWWAASMGATTEPLLTALRIPYRVVRHEDEIVPRITGAVKTMNAYRSHVALLFGGELM